MGSMIGWLMLKTGLGQKGARILAGVGLLLAVLAAIKIGFVIHDRSVIAGHDAKRKAATATADRKADAGAAIARRADDARHATEQGEIKEAIHEAKSSGTDPRAAYYRCVGLQQSARAKRQPPPDC